MTGKLTPRERSILCWAKGRYFDGRPTQQGGVQKYSIYKTCLKLCGRGLLERRPHETADNYHFYATAAGEAAIELLSGVVAERRTEAMREGGAFLDALPPSDPMRALMLEDL